MAISNLDLVKWFNLMHPSILLSYLHKHNWDFFIDLDGNAIIDDGQEDFHYEFTIWLAYRCPAVFNHWNTGVFR